MIYEHLGNGMTRVHTAENLTPQNRLHQDIRCDGTFYPSVNAGGSPTGISTSCAIADAQTVTVKLLRDTGHGREEGEGTWTLSNDGNHFATVTLWKEEQWGLRLVPSKGTLKVITVESAQLPASN